MSIQTDRASGGGSPAEAHQHRPRATTAAVDGQYSRLDGAGQLAATAEGILDAMARLDDVERAKLAGMFASRFALAEADLAPKQVAAAAGVAPSTVRGWCVAGLLGRRVGKRWRVSAAEVRALLAGGRS